MKDIENELIKGIKLNLWIHISYVNSKEENTKYYIGINDIDKDKISCKIFNPIHEKVLDTKISIKGIKEVTVIKNTYYNTTKAYESIKENNIFGYKEGYYNENLFDYYLACHKEETAFRKVESSIIEGIDKDSFKDNKSVAIPKEQVNKLLSVFEKNSDDKKSKEIKLAFNLSSIITKRNKQFPIAYKEIRLDLSTNSLILGSAIYFNQHFIGDDQSQTFKLSNYISIKPEKFIEQYETNYNEFNELIISNLDPGEKLDESPQIFQFQREFSKNFYNEYEVIKNLVKEETATYPIQSFFGMNKYEISKKRKNIVIYDNKVNVDQLKVLYKSIKHPVNYVQGPPGTGKTTTITNVVLTAFVNNDKVLITTENNKPLDDITESLSVLKYKGEIIPLPLLRLGNKEVVMKTLIDLSRRYKRIIKTKHVNMEIDKNLKVEKDKLDGIRKLLDDNERFNEISDHIRGLENGEEVSKDEQKRIKELEKERRKLGEVTNAKVAEFMNISYNNIREYLYNMSIKSIKRLESSRYVSIKNALIKDVDGLLDIDETEWHNDFKKIINNDSSFKLLLEVFPIILSTNFTVKNLGSPSKKPFDLLVVDEAAQSNPSHGLSALTRCKQALLVGDSNQLEPVITIDNTTNIKLMKHYNIDSRYDYTRSSLQSIMETIDIISEFTMLKDHYRCNAKIIDFSNKKYYANNLNIQTDSYNESPLKLISIENSNPEEGNTCKNEALEIAKYIKESDYDNSEIGVITPFAKQAKLLKRVLKEQGIEKVECGTIHKFQGAEKDLIFLSLAITENTKDKVFDWVKNHEQLLNVATTRAKEELVLVCNTDLIHKKSSSKSDLNELIEYVKTNGKTEVSDRTSDTYKSLVTGIKAFNSKSETEMLNILRQIASTKKGKLKIRTKDKIADWFDIQDHKFRSYFVAAHLDFVITNKDDKILAAIELNGIEHEQDENVKSRDKLKREFCEERGLKLISLPNTYARRYNYVKEKIQAAVKR